MSLANNVDPRSSGLPDTSFFYKPDEAFSSMQKRYELGIGIKDTVASTVVPFTRIGPDPYKNYQATPDRPLLDLSLINQRVLLKPGGDQAAPLPDNYQKIISFLPDELRTAFENPPLTEPLLIAMDKTFSGASTALGIFDGIGQAPPVDSPIEEDGIAFNQLPNTLSKTLTTLGNQWLPAFNSALETIGRNDPNYDSLSNLLNQTSESFGNFQNLLTALQQDPPPKNLNDIKAKVSDDVNRLNDLYNSKENGSDLQLLGSLLNALTLLSSALTTDKGNPSVMLAASLGNMGIESSKNPSGVLGPGLASINQTLANGLSDLYLPNATPGDKQMLNNLLNLGSVYGLGIGSTLANANYGEAALDYPRLNAFGYEVGMTFLSNTSALPKVFGLIGSAAGISEANLPAASKALSAAFLIQLVYTGAKGNASSFESLTKIVGGPLSQSLADIENDLNSGIGNGTVSGEKVNAINVGVTHARLALAQEDYEGFLSALQNLFEEMGTHSDQVNKDMKSISANGEVIQNAFNGATREGSEAITGIQRMA